MTECETTVAGMAAISLWMLALAVVGVAGVLTGHYPQEAPGLAS